MSGRCRSCNRKLQEHELVRKIKSPITGKIEYADMCGSCIRVSDLDVTDILGRFEPPLLEVDDE